MQQVFDQLQQVIAESASVSVGLAAHRLATGEEILINADMPFHPASTVKACVMMEVFRQARRAEFSLNDSLPVVNEFASLAGGTPFSLSADDDSEKELYTSIGGDVPIRELVRLMIVASSNLAANLLIQHVAANRITDFMRELGAGSLLVCRGFEDKQAYRSGINNSASAHGFMQILVKLAKREVVSPADSDAMIQVLTHHRFNEMIPARLPAGITVAHKSGWLNDLNHDIGIVFPQEGRPFVLAVLTRGFSVAHQAHALVSTLARTVYDCWS